VPTKRGASGGKSSSSGKGRGASGHASKPAARPAKTAAAPKPSKPAPAKPAAAKPAAGPTPDGQKKIVRKGITIVTPKPLPKKSKGRPSQIEMPTFGGALLRPGGPKRKPLIQSGPSAPSRASLSMPAGEHPRKSILDKKQLARFEEILKRKRAELAGDVNTLETEALKSQSGSLSHLPQHMAEQGSDAYGQSLSLDLAAADRRLIKEIDDALGRIKAGTYGICELTGKPIKAERLEELPWARYSIEAARELERRSRAP
jgi:DnaK suppressor protein